MTASSLRRTTVINIWGIALALGLIGGGHANAETLCGAEADVDTGGVVVVGLSTGDTLVVEFVGCEDGAAIVDHQLLGRLKLPEEAVAQVAAGLPGEDIVVDIQVFTDGEVPPPPAPAEAAAAAPAADDEPKLWESQAEFGLNGSEGNSERMSLRLGARTKRSTERRELTLDALYTRSDEASSGAGRETTENKAIGKGNHDWLFPDSAWRYFLGGTVEYDEFQDYDARLSASMGPAYAFIDDETTTLIGRAGIGTSWKVGGDDEDGFFELVFGYDFEHALSERQKIVSSARIFPNMSETGEFRAEARIAYDLKLDTPLELTVRLGIEDRYDSTTEDTATEEFEKNDLDYYATLIWDF